MPSHDPPSRHTINEEEPSNRDILREVMAMRGDVAGLRRFITGESEPAQGLIMRVDRLEQKAERNTWWASTALGAAIVAFVAGLYEIIKKGTVGP